MRYSVLPSTTIRLGLQVELNISELLSALQAGARHPIGEGRGGPVRTLQPLRAVAGLLQQFNPPICPPSEMFQVNTSTLI